MVKVHIVHDVDMDKLEKKINGFLENIELEKLIDIKFTSESSPAELSITRTALILYRD